MAKAVARHQYAGLYDEFGNPVQVQEAVRLAASSWRITRGGFDALNRLTSEGTYARALNR